MHDLSLRRHHQRRWQPLRYHPSGQQRPLPPQWGGTQRHPHLRLLPLRRLFPRASMKASGSSRWTKTAGLHRITSRSSTTAHCWPSVAIRRRGTQGHHGSPNEISLERCSESGKPCYQRMDSCGYPAVAPATTVQASSRGRSIPTSQDRDRSPSHWSSIRTARCTRSRVIMARICRRLMMEAT